MPDSTAFLFDLNGTMVDDMHYHIKAWHKILTDLGANLTFQQMKEECYGKNDELLERIFPGRFSMEEKKTMSLEKESTYQNVYQKDLALIKGLDVFLNSAKSKEIDMAIGSAAIQMNIDFVIDGLNIRSFFKSIVSADDVVYSKPHPETYLKCSDQLKIDPQNCIVFEDAIKGVAAAQNAGMKTVVLTTMHAQEEFSEFNNILCFVKDYTDPQLNRFF
ncbi:MAG: HAD family phosphatase [Chitinophagia bacterium]|nr:HAD family phosphatase [Chitinophagia bacterium]